MKRYEKPSIVFVRFGTEDVMDNEIGWLEASNTTVPIHDEEGDGEMQSHEYDDWGDAGWED